MSMHWPEIWWRFEATTPSLSTMSVETVDVHICVGNDLDACRGTFPHKDHPGLCTRCPLKNNAANKDKIEQIMEAVHCQGCGSVGHHFDRQKRLCGGCIGLKDHVEEDPKLRLAQELQDEAARLMAEARPDAYSACTSQAPRASREAPRTVPAGSRRISAVPDVPGPGLQHAAMSGRRIEVQFNPRVESHLFAVMGKVTSSYDADTPMPDVMEETVRRLNTSFWEKKRDVSVRWTGNIMPEPGTEGMTVGEFYDTHWIVSHRHNYFGNAPRNQKVRDQKIQHMCLELVIDVAGWEERTGCAPPPQCPGGKRGRPAGGKNGKRGRTTTADDSDGSAQKKPRGSAMQTKLATYVPSTAIRATFMRAQPSEKVQMTIATAKFNERELSLEASFFVDNSAKICSAQLEEAAAWSGKTKHVFKVDLDLNDGGKPHPYVAKRFFNVGNGVDKVSCAENAHYLTLDAERLERGQFYLCKFKELAKEAGVSIPTGFAFADFLLARENTEPQPGSDAPSKASGISAEKWAEWPLSDSDAGIIWLLERRRTGIVDRWSGTLDQPHRWSDRASATMGAFAHYSMLASGYSLVFVDLQSSHGHLRGGTSDGNVLFDPMTHTLAGESGASDHGIKGLEKFILDHTCSAVCKQLGLKKLMMKTLRKVVRKAQDGDADSLLKSSEDEESDDDENDSEPLAVYT
ncbi:kinase-like domain-containing protein [Cerioporus squamosus]|nr:kinase-like domain-containing protein [Cerioporus squamosus]